MRRLLREVPAAIWLIALLSGALAATVGCKPVGGNVADPVVTGLFAGAVVLLASQASWPALFLPAGMLAAVSPQVGFRAAAILAILAILLFEKARHLEPTAAAMVGLLSIQGLLRLHQVGPERGSAAIAAISVIPLLWSGFNRAPSRLKRLVTRAGGLTTVGFLLSVAIAGYAISQAQSALSSAEDDILAGVEAAQDGDREATAERFRAASIHFETARSTTHAWWSWPSRQFPIVGQQMRALDLVTSTGGATTDLAYEGAQRIDPDQLRMVDGRINLEAIVESQPIFEEVAHRSAEIRRRLAPGDDIWLLGPVRDGLEDFRNTVAQADRSAATAADAARLAPAILGGDGARHYLVAMVTPAEARASGGFMGNYAVLTADNGKLTLGPVGRKEDLNAAGDQATKKITGPADYVKSYERYDPAHTWENITLSPDFPSVAQAMAELFPQSGGRPVDGVIRTDPVALQGLLALGDPIQLPGLPRPLDGTNAADFLLREQYAIFSDQDQRIDLLGDIAEAAFDQFTSGQGARPAVVAQAMSPALQSGSLAFWFSNPEEQAVVERLGFADAVPAVEGHDSFGVTTQNAGASKIDVFLKREVDYEARLNPENGSITAEVDVVLQNNAPADGLAFYVIGNLVDLPLGTSRSFVSFYSPLGLDGATVDGEPVELVRETELGRNVYRTYLDIAPGASRTIHLDLTGAVNLSDGNYRFDYIPQVLTRPDTVTWELSLSRGKVGEATTNPGNTVTATDRSVDIDWPVSAGPWSTKVPISIP